MWADINMGPRKQEIKKTCYNEHADDIYSGMFKKTGEFAILFDTTMWELLCCQSQGMTI